MEELSCSILVFKDAKKVEVDFGEHSKIAIDLAGDVDFTPLVEKLAELFPLAGKIAVSPIPDKSIDRKEALVLETIVSFIGKFNLVQNPSEPETD